MDGGDRTAVTGLRCVLTLLVLSCGCSDVNATCKGGSPHEPNPEAEEIWSPTLTGETTLSTQQLAFSTAFHAELTGLPEVWIGAEPLSHVTLNVELDIAYVDPQPAGAPLPPITAVLEGEGTAEPAATVTLPDPPTHPGGNGPSVAPFVVCSSNSDEHCCPFGASHCSGGATLQLTRTADLFPRVRVRYTVTAHASVYSCLEDASSATWNLAEVGP